MLSLVFGEARGSIVFFAIPHQLARKRACSTHVVDGVFGHEERVRRSVELKGLGERRK
jgi:hypothetical protein